MAQKLVYSIRSFLKIFMPMKRKRSGVAGNALVKRQRRDAVYMALPRGNVQGRAVARAGYRTVPRTRGVYAQGEMKYFESGKESLNIPSSADWTGTEADPSLIPVAGINTLFCPIVGSAINQRIGKSCKLLGLRIRGRIFCNNFSVAGAGVDGATVRMLLVQDMQTNATQMQGEQVLATVLSTSSAIQGSLQNINNFGRFRVIKDKIWKFDDFNTTASSWVSGQMINFKWNIKFKEPVTVHFNAVNGGTIADIVDNSFHLLCNATSQVPQMQLEYMCRCMFKE
jgi:hypothetical protein